MSYDYPKFVHRVPVGYTIPKGTQVRGVSPTPDAMETFFVTLNDHMVSTSEETYYLDYDITKPKLPEEINSVIYNVRIGATVFPVAVYQGARVWSAFTCTGKRTVIYTPEIVTFDMAPPTEEEKR